MLTTIMWLATLTVASTVSFIAGIAFGDGFWRHVRRVTGQK